MITHDIETNRDALIKVSHLRKLFPDGQLGPDFIAAVENALFILLQRANDRRLTNRRTRFFPCDV